MQPTQVYQNCRKSCSSRGMFFSGGLITLTAVVFLASSLWGFEESSSKAPGLRGIIPKEIPPGLDAEAFSVLDGNWESWSTEVAGKMASLYTDESLDAAGQRQLIDVLKSKLDVMERSLADDSYRSIFEPLIDLHGKMARQIHVAEAALDTLELDAKIVKESRLKKARQNVSRVVGNLERDMDQFQGGDGWLRYVRTKELKQLMAGGTAGDPVLQGVRKKLQERESLSDESQREFLSRKSFGDLEKAIVALLEADAREPKQVDTQKLRESLAALLAALSEYELTSGIEAAGRVHASLQEVTKHSLDEGDRIEDSLRNHYFNHNLRVAVSEQFLNRAFKEKRTEKGPVDDFILGAKVRGTQTTTTTLGIDLRPQQEGARFAIKADGVVRSSTSGTTDKAVIYTEGYHTFAARKEVVFDGNTFTVKPATISVDANNRTVGASTDYSGTLLGGFAQKVAMREARKRRSQSESIARGRVADRVLPKFNKEVNEQFADADKQLESRVNSRLRDAGLMPELREFSTTEKGFFMNTRTMTGQELGGDAPSFNMDPGRGIVLALHESVMNNAIDKLALAGQALTEKELIHEVEKSLSKLLGRDVNLSSSEENQQVDEKNSDKFLFDPNDPSRIRIEDGLLNLVLKTGLKQEGKEEIPAQVITIPLSIRVEGNQLLIETGTVRVAPAVKPKSTFRQIARAGVMRKKIETAVGDRKRDRKISFIREGKDDLIVTLTRIQALDGWLVIWAE